MRICIILIFAVLTSSLALGSPASLTYQGRILKSDGTPLEHSNVAFIFQITNSSGGCIVYQEQFTGYNMAGSKGMFDVPIGSGTVSWPASGGFTVLDAFNNSAPLACGACAGYSCSAGSGSYNPALTDGRRLKVQFHDGNGWKLISPDTEIRSVPFAGFSMSAQKLGTREATAFVLKDEVNSNTSCGGGGQFLTWNATTKTFGCSGVSGSSGGTVTAVTAASPLSVAAGTESSTPHLTIQASSASQNGYLSSTDWTAFNNKLGPATIFAGDISGTASSISVDKIKNVPVVTSSLAAGDVLKYSGGNWVNGPVAAADVSGLSSLIGSKADYSQFPTTCTAAQTLTFISPVGGFTCTNIAIAGSQVSGNISGTASGFTGSLSGDVTGTQAATVVGKLQGVGISATAPTNNQVLKYNGFYWTPSTLSSGDLPSGTLSGSGTTGRLPYYSAANVLSDSVVSQTAGQVGIGTTSPEGLLDVRGTVSVGGAHSNVANPNASLVVRSYDNPHLIFEKTGYNTGGIAVDDNNLVFASEMADITFRTGVDYNGDFASTGSEILRIKNNGQVGIGTSAPAASAILDLVSFNKGLLAPRMTQAQRDAIVSPAAGLMVYNTTANAMNIFNGSSWGALGAGSLGSNSVMTSHIQNSAVTLDKIDFSSTTKGLGLPTMTTAQIAAISSPTAGMVVFNSTTGASQVYNGTTWKDLVASSGGSTVAPSISVTSTGSQTVTANTIAKLTFNTVEFDTNSNWSAVNNQFTPTVAGKYIVTVSSRAVSDTSTDWNSVAVRKNGVVVSGYGQVIASLAGQGMPATTAVVVDMNGTTDYIEGVGLTSTTSINTKKITAALLTSHGVGGGSSLSGSGTSNYVPVWTSGTNLGNSPLAVSSGNVGIGTTNPTAPLDVNGYIRASNGSNSAILIDSAAGNNRTMAFRTSAVNRWAISVNSTAEGGSNAGSDFQLSSFTDAGGALGTPFFIQRSTGNVGLGTTAPDARLHVQGAVKIGASAPIGRLTVCNYVNKNFNFGAGGTFVVNWSAGNCSNGLPNSTSCVGYISKHIISGVEHNVAVLTSNEEFYDGAGQFAGANGGFGFTTDSAPATGIVIFRAIYMCEN